MSMVVHKSKTGHLTRLMGLL